MRRAGSWGWKLTNESSADRSKARLRFFRQNQSLSLEKPESLPYVFSLITPKLLLALVPRNTLRFFPIYLSLYNVLTFKKPLNPATLLGFVSGKALTNLKRPH
jgi:hypothetical protein